MLGRGIRDGRIVLPEVLANRIRCGHGWLACEWVGLWVCAVSPLDEKIQSRESFVPPPFYVRFGPAVSHICGRLPGNPLPFAKTYLRSVWPPLPAPRGSCCVLPAPASGAECPVRASFGPTATALRARPYLILSYPALRGSACELECPLMSAYPAGCVSHPPPPIIPRVKYMNTGSALSAD